MAACVVFRSSWSHCYADVDFVRPRIFSDPPQQEEKAFLASIAETNRERTAVLFEELLEEAAGYFVQFEGVVNFLLFLLGEIEEWIRRKGFELSSWLDGDLYGKLYIARDITEVREWFTDTLFPAIDERLRQHDVKRADHELIQQVRRSD